MPLTSLATIPSPGSNAIGLGPLDLRMYGFMIALGVIAAVWLARCFQEAGFPPGVFNVVQGEVAEGKALVEHDDGKIELLHWSDKQRALKTEAALPALAA